MSRKSLTPGEHRRRKVRARAKEAKPEFTRPREWAEAELHGVLNWLKSLKSPEADKYPEDWRKGQTRHYKHRARELRAEIKAHRRRERAGETPADPSSSVA